MATAFLWHGFDHAWLRSVLGFRLPHRISLLESYIEPEAGDNATLHFGHATGMDGNYMKPEGYYSAVCADGLRVEHGCERLRWTDDIDDDPVPHARSTLARTITTPGQLLLRGVSLRTRCDPAKQPASHPGNSDGMWPYLLSVQLEGSKLNVEIARGWTPNKGGLPGIEEKPLTRRLDFALDVAYTALSGDAEVLAVTAGETAVAEAPARQNQPVRPVTAIAGVGGGVFAAASSGVTGFSFELTPPTSRRRHLHRGRYIGALGFRVGTQDYDPASGMATVEHAARVWVPVTVSRSNVRYRLRSSLVQVGGPGAAATPTLLAQGSLCCESAPDAPFFSHWKRCGGRKTGPGRTRDQQPIRAPL